MCLLQLAKICAKCGSLVCACGTSPCIDWILRSHEALSKKDEEEKLKRALLASGGVAKVNVTIDKLLLF